MTVDEKNRVHNPKMLHETSSYDGKPDGEKAGHVCKELKQHFPKQMKQEP